MPRIFDNIDEHLLPALQQTLDLSYRADFCVGYFNLRGWKSLAQKIDQWTGGEGAQVRLLVGMQRLPQEVLRTELSLADGNDRMTQGRIPALKRQLAEEFRNQLMFGAPTNEDEAALRQLAAQIRQGKVVIKLFLRHLLHAKLYLLFQNHYNLPRVAYMGSSNLTFSGLEKQGELNVDVTDADATQKLAQWFEDRWEDRWCVDISNEVVEIIEESWAGEAILSPYYIYLKMAYHLSQEAREGLSEFAIPRIFRGQLFDFQKAAVQIAARYIHRRNGVLIGDVVGLGKTMMATAVAKIFEEDFDMTTLIICPANLVKMWESYVTRFQLRAQVLSIGKVQNQLPDMVRYRLVLIDESHNLRNREGKRYRVIREYIERNESRCILLSATPYNKTFLDLSNQLRLFVSEDADLGIRPEALLREMSELEFSSRYAHVPIRSLQAFERSTHPDDWRELMSRYMVRRTRSFIKQNYAYEDSEIGRRYLEFPDGRREYFPDRVPKRVDFAVNEDDPNDSYARLYDNDVVEAINGLALPRYGLQQYLKRRMSTPPNDREQKLIDDLSRGGRRLMGFCRTNLFKRLESSGYAFLLSVDRHILRNCIFIHALENNLPLPIGSQDAEMLETEFDDEDVNSLLYGQSTWDIEEEEEAPPPAAAFEDFSQRTVAGYAAEAAQAYNFYRSVYARRFRWLRADLFRNNLVADLRADVERLLSILHRCGRWDPAQDAQLDALHTLITQTHADKKVLIFSQFADTVRYLEKQLQARGVDRISGVTGNSFDPTELAWHFSPVSNGQAIPPEDELRVLVATDVLSEGQNLQDCAIVVNYDLPWAIIRLIQRAGRVDRIGQQAHTILCYTFWPADGLERIIKLRSRLRQRLRENEEVVGADEAFFEDDGSADADTAAPRLLALYNENSGALDEVEDDEIDLVSYAYQIWKNATDANPSLRRIVQRLPDVSHATKLHQFDTVDGPPGALVFVQTGQGINALAWMDGAGRSVSYSQRKILDAAACSLDEPGLPHEANHYELVRAGVEQIRSMGVTATGGQLGRRTGARFRVYERLKAYIDSLRGQLFEHAPQTETLSRALDQIYTYPLTSSATEKINRQLRSQAHAEQLAELVVALYEEEKLCVIHEAQDEEPQIICSMGLA